MPSETYVIDILKGILEKKTKEFNDLTIDINGLLSTDIYPMMEATRKDLSKKRRELRGEMSALRQAIRTLEEENRKCTEQFTIGLE